MYTFSLLMTSFYHNLLFILSDLNTENPSLYYIYRYSSILYLYLYICFIKFILVHGNKIKLLRKSRIYSQKSHRKITPSIWQNLYFLHLNLQGNSYQNLRNNNNKSIRNNRNKIMIWKLIKSTIWDHCQIRFIKLH